MREIRAVDDHEAGGCGRDDRVRGLADQAQQLRQLQQHRGEADDRQLLDRKQRAQPFARHGAAADTVELNGIAETLAQHLHQAGTEPVTGFFGRDQEDPAPDDAAWANRTHAATPVTNSPAASAAAITPCGSTICVAPATTAIPARAASRAPSIVLAPIVGRSKRRSWPVFGAFTSTPRPVAERLRPCPRSYPIRASRPSVPSMSSMPTTWPSITTVACPTSNGLKARSTSRP